MKTKYFSAGARTLAGFFLVSGLILSLGFGALPGLAGASKEEFPEEISGDMKFVLNAKDTPGCWNVPHCEHWDCTTDMILNFKLAKTDGDRAEYKIDSGSWQLSGKGDGSLTETFADQTCTVTINHKYSGSGSFTPNSPDNATLTYNRSDRSFILTFIICSGQVNTDIKYTCMGRNIQDSATYYAMGESVGKADLNDGELTFDLGYSSTSTNSNIPGSQYDHIASGNLTGAGLKADFSVTPETRGQVSLDASKSTGKIKKYTWTFSAADQEKGIKFDGEAKLEGKKVDVVLLVPLTVKLTVENEKGVKKSKEKKINIQPRNWETKCVYHPEMIGSFTCAVWKAVQGSIPPERTFGTNTCSLCAEILPEGSIYHPPGKGSSSDRDYEDNGYTIEKVADGPFKGTFYIKKCDIKIERKPLLNPNLLEVSPFYQLNLKKKMNIARFRDSTLEHEKIHARLLQEALKEHNPGKELDKLFAETHDELKTDANRLLNTMEEPLLKKFWDEEEVRRQMHDIYGDEKCELIFENVDQEGEQIKETPYIKRSFYLYNKSQSRD